MGDRKAGTGEQEDGIGNWAPPFSSPEAGRATTAAMLPHAERQAFLDSLPPVTQEMRDAPWYAASKQEEAEPEAGA